MSHRHEDERKKEFPDTHTSLISHVIIKPYMKYNMTCTHVHLDCEVTTGDLDMY